MPPATRPSARWLADISPCLRAIQRQLFIQTSTGRQVVEERFRRAADAVVEYQVWVALEQPCTVKDLRTSFAQLTSVMVTGFYHDLPRPVAVSTSRLKVPTFASWLRGTRWVITGAVPIAAVMLLPTLGISLPDPLRQWITGLALLWLVAKVIKLLDPADSVRDMHQVLKSGSKSQ